VPIRQSPGSAAADGNDQPLQLPRFLPHHTRSSSILKQRRGGHNGDGPLSTTVDGNLPNSTPEVAVEGDDEEAPQSAMVKQEGKAALGEGVPTIHHVGAPQGQRLQSAETVRSWLQDRG
jgi:hypothetical protein